jgi:8-oxo-dGTP diphosphatase
VKRFPSGQYGRQKLTFYPAPFRSPLRAFASLVFAWEEDRVLICDILDRGWCIPSGRVEPAETSLEAANREALEEGGATLSEVQYLGCYQICDRQETRWADCFAARIAGLAKPTIPEESGGAKLVRVEELPEIYHLWNPLTAMVFDYSHEVVNRRK